MASGPANFRDLAGTPLAGGAAIAPNRLLRSEQLEGLDPAEAAAVTGRGVAVVCDLRTAGERQGPQPWDAAAVIEVARPDDLHARLASPEVLADGSGAAATELVESLYRGMPEGFADPMLELIESIAAGGVPALVHCRAGKDRTGFVIAAMLAWLGADRDAVVADYVESNRAFDAARLERVLGEYADGVTPQMVSAFECRPGYLQAAFDRIDADHGSLDAYFRDRVGAGDELRRQVLAALTGA